MRTTLLLSVAAHLLVSRADPTVDQENALLDPTAECAPYNYAPVTNALSAFPAAGTPVTGILAGDTAAQSKFDSFKANIPNIAPRGVNGVFATNATSSYPATDPDCWWTFGQCLTPKVAGLKPDIADVPEPRTLGYGFDDGPNCSHNAFYDYLTSKKQKATMFFIGTNVMFEPLQALRAAQDGHEICVHTWSHHPMTAFTNEQAFAELWYTMQSIKLVTGYTPTCWRPPQGDVDDRIRYIAQQLNLDNILWKYDAFDWKVASGQATPAEVQTNYDNLVADVGKGTFDTVGAIMLTHELDNYTMQTAIDNYPKLAAAFDHIVPVGVGYNKTQPYVEKNFTLPSFAQCTCFLPFPCSSPFPRRDAYGPDLPSFPLILPHVTDPLRRYRVRGCWWWWWCNSASSSGGSTKAGSGSGSNTAAGSSPSSSGGAAGTGAAISVRLSFAGVLVSCAALLGAALVL